MLKIRQWNFLLEIMLKTFHPLAEILIGWKMRKYNFFQSRNLFKVAEKRWHFNVTRSRSKPNDRTWHLLWELKSLANRPSSPRLLSFLYPAHKSFFPHGMAVSSTTAATPKKNESGRSNKTGRAARSDP